MSNQLRAAEFRAPTSEDAARALERLHGLVRRTPVWDWRGERLAKVAGGATSVNLKLELFQHTGSFKPRGALVHALGLDAAALERGVTAVSAGNHALAVGYAARVVGTTAKVVMPRSADPARVAGCRDLGAEVVLVEDVHAAFEEVRRIEEEEGRWFIHPFEHPNTILGTATVGLEWIEQVDDLDAVIVPIGGGGLCAGIATMVKELRPQWAVLGVEPEGADTMRRSFASGKPEAIDAVRTIADSLGAPHAAPYSFELCLRSVDALVTVSDDEMRRAMKLLFDDAKLAVEPAGAAATAALCGPLRSELSGKRVGVLVCGANIDHATFAAHLAAAGE